MEMQTQAKLPPYVLVQFSVASYRTHDPPSWVKIISPHRDFQSMSEQAIKSLYITQHSCEAPRGSYRMAWPAANHYYRGGQTEALDKEVLCIPFGTAPGNWSLTNCVWMCVCVCVKKCVFVIHPFEHTSICRMCLNVCMSAHMCVGDW